MCVGLQELRGTLETLSALGDGAEQIVHADGARAGAGEQNTTGTQHLHTQQVEAAIGFEGLEIGRAHV